MTYEEAAQLFRTAGLPLTELLFQQFSAYLEELVENNQYINLTAITDPAEIWAKHFLDCAVLLQKVPIPLGASCLDVGTGAGFPGMVLAILRPDLLVTLLDSLQKRLDFLERTAEKLGIANVRCIHLRAEDGARDGQYREQFDFVTARAVASLPVLTEYCLGYVRVGGCFAAMKGPGTSPAEGAAAVSALGGEMEPVIQYDLEGVGARQIFVVRKRNQTPAQYPRRGDKIKKKPLGAEQ